MRIWRTSPFVALIAVVALAMGIGFTTTMFSIVHGATRALPVAEPHEVVAIEQVDPRAGALSALTRHFELTLWSGSATSFELMGGFASVEETFTGGDVEPERVAGVAISPEAFTIVGRAALHGRGLVSDDRRTAARVVVLSHALWQRRYAADPSIVGRSIRIGAELREVVGVMPPRFGFPVNARFWIPLDPSTGAEQPGAGPVLTIFGRLADDVGRDAARVELQTLSLNARHAALGSTAEATDLRVRVMPFQDLETPREVIRGLYVLVLAVSFVLLIACGNVANLLLARAAVRARDVAVRLALGATRRQIVVEQLGEVLSLVAVATVLGVVLAYGGTRVFAVNTAHIIEAFWVDFRVDGVVLLFASGLAAVATLAAGLGPALRVSRFSVAEVLKQRTQGLTSLSLGRWSRGMIAAQVALACGLLALTMLLGRAAVGLRTVPWPFDPESIMTFEFEMSEPLVSDPVARNQHLRSIASALSTTPGVTAAGLTTTLPGRSGAGWTVGIDAPATDRRAPRTSLASVSPEFFSVIGVRARSGRLLTWQDDATAPRVVVVNESFVRQFLSDGDPLGRRLFLGERDFTVVGVIPDAMARDVQDRDQDGIYASIQQVRPYGIRVMASTIGDPAAIMPSLRAAIRAVDTDLPLAELFTLHEAVYREKRVLDVLSSLFMVFGVGALSLTAIGLYGVVSFGVTQRTRELGVRMALGASRSDVLRLVVGQSGRHLLGGLIAGTALALGLSRAFAAAVEQLPAADAPLLLLIASAIGATTLLAMLLPARRAVTLPIVQALRGD